VVVVVVLCENAGIANAAKTPANSAVLRTELIDFVSSVA
jgi:hypothetical protein